MTILPFDSTEATLENAGGKGMNLARLARAGFDVPRGFIISTVAYREFVSANRWLPEILSGTADLSAEDAAALDRASAQIRAAFSTGRMPDDLKAAIREAYADLGERPVAVRSSATAEDLPDLSFAGQQDTYLNVIGAEQLLEAVIHCWSSLWTARAIGYRIRNGIDHHEAALAVIVQEMVQSEASGVLFTANPLTGLRNESVIDATLGLGEALVSGQVEPDHYVVDTSANRILTKTLGAKKLSTRGKTGGGVETIEEPAAARPALSDSQILAVAMLGQRIQKEYSFPQDIEWALADDKLSVLQSRPITSLFPVPELSFDPLIVWFSFGAAQGLVGPMTPLGIDTVRHIFAGAGQLFDSPLKPEDVQVFASAGERIWIRVSDLIRNPVGNRLLRGAMGIIEPSAGKILQSLMADSRLHTGKGQLKLDTLSRVGKAGFPVALRLGRNLIQPEDARARFDARIDAYLSEAKISPAADRFGRLMNVVMFIRQHISGALRYLLPHFVSLFGPTMAAFIFLREIAGDDQALAFEITRSLPGNVTTEMDLMLWQTALRIREDAESADLFRGADARTLARHYLNGILPAAAQSAIASFMEKYGMRGVGEIDMGQPRWREEPTPIMHTLQSYLNIDKSLAPDAMFAKGKQAALDAIDTLSGRARLEGGPMGWLRERQVRAAARRIRLLMGARESPKFFMIRLMGDAHRALLESGQEFVDAQTVERATDLFFLKVNELEALARNESRDWKALVADRRAIYEREQRRRQVPRILVSDGRAFYEGLGSETDTGGLITGSPVSPGVAEGNVHIILDPRGAQLSPGEILVCPGTDPAWTPLFMAAGGLITEVGGMMTHGSVVAREYGIPAVVGVHEATTRLKNGQRIRIDGTAGKIMILDEKS